MSDPAPALTRDDAAPAPRIGALDSLRGVAALIVVCCHALWMSPLAVDPGHPARILRRLLGTLFDGAPAVDFFFVLSGFVLTLPFLPPRARPLRVDEFVLRRIVRIMPIYWAGTALALLLRALAAPHFDLLDSSAGVDWRAPLQPRDLFQLAALIFRAPGPLLNAPIWSLQVEMRMSLLLPLIIAALTVAPGLRASLTVLAVATAAPAFLEAKPDLGFLPLFVLGALLAQAGPRVYARARALSPRARAAALGLSALLFVYRTNQHGWGFPDMRPEYMSGIASAALIALVMARAEVPAPLRHPAVVALGEMSYSLYLMHLPLLLATAAFVKAAGGAGYLPVLVAVPIAIAGSAALHRWVERPLIAAGRRFVRLLLDRRWIGRGALTVVRPAAAEVGQR